MAYFSRLIAFVLAFAPLLSNASLPSFNRWMGNPPYGGFPTTTGWAAANTGTLDGECAAHFSGTKYHSSSEYNSQTLTVYCYSPCPDGSKPDASGVCEAPPTCPSAGTVEGDASNAYTTDSKVPSNNLCIGSCSWSSGGVVPSVCANGKCYYYGPFTSNGTACTGEGGAPAPEEPDPAPPDDAQCVAKGQCPGTINGTKVCVPCSSKEGTTSESGWPLVVSCGNQRRQSVVVVAPCGHVGKSQSGLSTCPCGLVVHELEAVS